MDLQDQLEPIGQVDRYKAILVAKAFSQIHGVDFDEIFSSVVKFDSIRSILSIVVVENMEMIQFEVKTTFLHGDLKEEIYME